MGSEVCPFCGKTYKRLKSHLPHCKAAGSSRAPPAPPARHEAPAKQTPFSELNAASHTATTARNKSNNASVGSSKQLPSTPVTSASRPPSAKKTKQKVSEQIKMATVSLVSTASPVSTESKNQSLQALNEADKHIKPRDAPKKNMPPIKTDSESLPTKKASDTLHASSRNKLCVDHEGEAECLSVNKLLIKSRSGQQGRITLQDVKATLRRTKASSQSSVLSITNQTQAASDLSLSSGQASLIPLQHDAAPEPKLASTTLPLLSGQRSCQAVKPLSHTISTSEGSKVSRHMTGLLWVSPAPTHNPSPCSFQLPPPVGVEAPRAGEGLVTERLQLKVSEENSAEGALTQRRLGQVRLRELPEWLACRAPRTPRDLVDTVQRGWQWYHRRYIDVRKGGAGGVGLLLAGYCVLSYIWTYPHIKRDRWRKYH